MTVLVVTDSPEGPPQKIAQLVADALGERDIDVTVGDISDLERSEEFEGVVFGGEVDAGEYSPDTLELLSSRASALSQQLVWLFAVGDENGEDTPDPVSELAALDYRSFSPSPGEDEVRSWAAFIADEIDGHS
ncbi:Flavodoxin [Rhodococcus gordoniae]|uniref:Flavodoxin n=1 Tax=Rhodococcus gordoniae TaxID=223392 RepID=A0A379M1T2_9NOCA|nr:flavodoxin domain-containing protein [Rhodococcus gordoniae]SUE16269.1 Flavodoxin [Rhodococcus gordoniae]